LAGLNQSLCGKFKCHFATAAYIFVDMERKSMSYAAAGHPPLLLWHTSTGTASEVLENGLPLGLLLEATYSVVNIPVEPGDKAILYTDGIPETTSPSEQEFGPDLLKGFLESNHDLGADVFADLLFDELADWSEHPKGQGQQDDVTLLAIDFKSH
jgi:phosphoserine phosphatase RsbU/P